MKKKPSYDEEELNFEVPEIPEVNEAEFDELAKLNESVLEAPEEPWVEGNIIPTVQSGETVQVHLINFDEFDGKYLVVDDDGNGYLVPKALVSVQKKPQSISKRALDEAERPYNWDTEIESIAISVSEIRRQLWRDGLIRQDSVESLRALLLRLVQRGSLPVIKEER